MLRHFLALIRRLCNTSFLLLRQYVILRRALLARSVINEPYLAVCSDTIVSQVERLTVVALMATGRQS